MKKNDVLARVRKQLSIDLNCKEEDFDYGRITVTDIAQKDGCILYGDEDRALIACYFGGGAVFSVVPDMQDHCRRILDGHDPEWVFDTSSLIKFSEFLYLHGHNIGNLQQYYVPDPELPKTQDLFSAEWIPESDLCRYKNEPAAEGVLHFDAKAPDKLCLVVRMNGKIVGMASAKADSPLLWQISVRVLPEYRGKGIAENLLGQMKDAVLEKDLVPYYGSTASHTITNAVGAAAGFFPAWVRIFSRPRTDEFLHIHDAQ